MAVGQVLGVDVGATKTLAARLQGEVVRASARLETRSSSSEELLDLIAEAVRRVDHPEVGAIGVCLPTALGLDQRVTSGAELPLLGVDVEAALTSRFGRPTVVENDGNAAAYAESFHADGTRSRHLVMMTVGTGIGGGLVIDGSLYRGATGAAGELGQMIIDATAEFGSSEGQFGFPRPGALERLASGSALERLARAMTREPDSSPRHHNAAGPIDGLTLSQLAKAGDLSALEAFRRIGRHLGLAAANLINVFDPDELVIGGGVGDAGELLLAVIRDTAEPRLLPGVGLKTIIRSARHASNAGVIGAGLLAAPHAAAHVAEVAGPPRSSEQEASSSSPSA